MQIQKQMQTQKYESFTVKEDKAGCRRRSRPVGSTSLVKESRKERSFRNVPFLLIATLGRCNEPFPRLTVTESTANS